MDELRPSPANRLSELNQSFLIKPKLSYCLGTRSKRMRLRRWSSSSMTAARGYICSMSKWNWTPAGGSRRKFLLSWEPAVRETEASVSAQGADLTNKQERCWNTRRPTAVQTFSLQRTGTGSVAGWSPPRCSPPREGPLLLHKRQHRKTNSSHRSCVQMQS